jgi:hypothetical protein
MQQTRFPMFLWSWRDRFADGFECPDTRVIGCTTICLVVRHRVSRFVGQIYDQAAGVRDAFCYPQNDTATRWFQLDTSSLLASDQRKPVRTCQIQCRIFRRELPCKTRADRPKGACETIQVWSFLFQSGACNMSKRANSSFQTRA